MSIYDFLNAAFSKSGYVPPTTGVHTGGVPHKSQNVQKVPSFGVKLRAPLEKDTFQSSGEKGQPMVSYKGKTMTLEQARIESYNEVNSHEEKHLEAAKGYGHSKVINYDGNGIAVSGHVQIQMPHFDKKNPDKTIAHAEIVKAAAVAPEEIGSELSDADRNVYAQADAVLQQALAFKAEQSSNPFAKDKNPFATNPFANRA